MMDGDYDYVFAMEKWRIVSSIYGIKEVLTYINMPHEYHFNLRCITIKIKGKKYTFSEDANGDLNFSCINISARFYKLEACMFDKNITFVCYDSEHRRLLSIHTDHKFVEDKPCILSNYIDMD